MSEAMLFFIAGAGILITALFFIGGAYESSRSS
jgi:hypothetical protein